MSNLASRIGVNRNSIEEYRETVILNQMRVNHNVTSSSMSDFEIDGKTFEVGGRSKNQHQIAGAKEGYVVKDDIEPGFANTIPLWSFALNY